MTKSDLITIIDLSAVYEVEVAFFSAIIEQDLIEVHEVDGDIHIDSTQLGKLEQILSLANDLKVNLEGIDVIFNLLERIARLEEELINAKHKLDFFER